MKSILLCLLSLSLVSCTTTYAGEKIISKVGYIDLQRLVNESKMGQSAKKEIQSLRVKKEKAIEIKMNEINKLKDLLNDSQSNLDINDKREKTEELQKIYKEYQRLVEDAKEDIAREDRELVALILDKADGVLKDVAKKEKYTIIVKDPNAIGYLDPSVDITEKVLDALNRIR